MIPGGRRPRSPARRVLPMTTPTDDRRRAHRGDRRAPHERIETRSNQRNGSRSRLLSTPAGDVELRIPKVRVGSFFPSLLEPRRRVDKALWGVIMTAYMTGTSTRKVDDLVRALGCESGVSKSTVSRICAGIDDEVAVFRSRRLDHVSFPYVYLDATYIKAWINHRIVSRAVVVATGVTVNGATRPPPSTRTVLRHTTCGSSGAHRLPQDRRSAYRRGTWPPPHR